MDFWIDQYGDDLDIALEAALKVSRGEYNDDTWKKLNALDENPNTTAGLLRQFCQLVVIFDLKAVGRHGGEEGLEDRIETFLKRLSHSNFVADDANILAGVIAYLARGDERITRIFDRVYGKKTDTQFKPDLVHPKIALIARNLHPDVDELYKKIGL
ncbi:MAG TPA: hypothetical protein VNH64_05915 [Parvularculaceae bacterium]|nr:hypothetical protein [Parvularculaceae bacterium]